MALTLANLVDRLKKRVRANAEEAFSDPADYKEWLIDASARHNPSYVLSDAACTVPDVEAIVLVTLAWAGVMRIRASKLAMSPSQTNPAGFGTDRNSPYYRCIHFAEQLEADYKRQCSDLRLQDYAGGGSPVLSELSTEDTSLSASVPFAAAPTMPKPILTLPTSVSGDGTIIVRWTLAKSVNFDRVRLFYVMGSNSIYEEWNTDGSLFPTISDSAEEVDLGTKYRTAVKLTAIPVTQGLIHRFILAAVGRSGEFTLSDEVVVTQP
jgi:hypothetical protein